MNLYRKKSRSCNEKSQTTGIAVIRFSFILLNLNKQLSLSFVPGLLLFLIYLSMIVVRMRYGMGQKYEQQTALEA